MISYRLIVAYDGTDYHGWQTQSSATTVCGTMEAAFLAVFFQKASILGASRTDAGVHALHQVAILQTTVNIDPEQMLRAWSKALPPDIVLRKIEKLSHLIHPHDGVVQKTYAYYVFLQRPLPHLQRYGWFIYKPVDLALLDKTLQTFVGTHDFRSFCSGNDLLDTVRTIDSIQVQFVAEKNAYRIELKGKSFLRYMVRRIVGASLEVALSSEDRLNELREIFALKNPQHTLPNAPAKGLFLEQIAYSNTEWGVV